MTSTLPVVGIDVSKTSSDAHWGSQKGKRWRLHFSNDAQGFEILDAWIREQGASRVHVCLEATSTYSDAVAAFCFARGHVVSVLAPHKIHAFRTSEGILSKTDTIDALLLARYGEQKRPAAWHPVSAAANQLKRDLDRLDELKEMYRQEKNRLENQRLDQEARHEIDEHLSWLKERTQRWSTLLETRFAQAWKQEQEVTEELNTPEPPAGKKNKRPRKKGMQVPAIDVLMQVTGIGRLSALRMYAIFATLQEVGSSEQVACYFGVVPHQKESGTSVKGKTRRRGGNKQARNWLYMCALTSKRCDPDMKQWAAELQGRGLCKAAVIVAVMHKLVRILFGLFKMNAPYDATKAFPSHYPKGKEEAALAA